MKLTKVQKDIRINKSLPGYKHFAETGQRRVPIKELRKLYNKEYLFIYTFRGFLLKITIPAYPSKTR